MINYNGIFTKLFIIFIFIFQSSILSAYSAENFFVTQSGAGLHNGLSVENAFSVSDFNNSVNWGTGAGQINGGDTVYLSGRVTTELNMQGSGYSGNVITIDGTSATLANKFIVNSISYFKLQNFTYASGLTIRADHNYFPNGLFALVLSSNGEINNLTIPGFNGYHALEIRGSSYITFDGLTATDLNKSFIDLRRYDLANQTHHITFRNMYIETTKNYIPDEERDIMSGCAHDITVEKSYIKKRWSSAAGPAHNDIWQFWGNDVPGYEDPACVDPYNMTLRHSILITEADYDGNYQFLMWSNGSGTNNNIYGNIFVKKGSDSLGSVIAIRDWENGAVANIYNNTFVQKDTGAYGLLWMEAGLSGRYTTLNFKNNIVYNSQTENGVINKSKNPSQITFNHAWNTYYGGKSTGYLGMTCDSYKSTGEVCNTDPLFNDYANDDFRIGTNSSAYNSGTDLGSVYKVGLSTISSPFSNPILTIERPQDTLWDRGAYEYIGVRSKAPNAPYILGIN